VLLVFNRGRYVVLFLLMTRLVRPNPRWLFLVGILGMEVALGFARFFADFREPLVIVALAVLGATDRRQAKTWVTLGVLGLLAISSGLIWTAIKPLIRKNYVSTATSGQRLSAVVAVTGNTFSKGAVVWKYEGDSMVSRIWAVYFPALALQRVPSILPYENGAILKGAISNIVTPRLFFPNKPILASQSDEVRKYAGVWVSGRENNTSYAFGYAGEAYVDFGVPVMFVPVLVFGLLMGVAYRWLQKSIRHDELRAGVIIVTFGSTLAVYEASWVMMIGMSLTILTVLGGSAIIVDRMLTSVERAHSKSNKARPVQAWPRPERQPG
jgi:hypothetical protein